MRNKHQLSLPPMPVEAVDHGASIACPAQVNSVDVSALLRGAVESSGVQHKEAAYSAGYQPDYWTRVLDGERGIHLSRLGKLPEPVQREFVKRYAAQLKMRIADEDDLKRAIAAVAEAAVHLLARIA